MTLVYYNACTKALMHHPTFRTRPGYPPITRIQYLHLG